MRRGAARGPALVVDGDGVEGHVRVGVFDVHWSTVTSPPSPIGPMPVSLRLEQLVLELSDDGIGVAGADRAGDRLLGEVHRVVGGAAMPTPTMPGGHGLPPAPTIDSSTNCLMPFTPSAGTHLQEAHVLGAGALGHALHVEAVPLGDELPSARSARR